MAKANEGQAPQKGDMSPLAKDILKYVVMRAGQKGPPPTMATIAKAVNAPSNMAVLMAYGEMYKHGYVDRKGNLKLTDY